MRNHIQAILVCLQVLLLYSGCAAIPADAPCPETPSEAPSECIQATMDFIHYLLEGKTNIADDVTSQSRWLTKSLRTELAETVKRCKEESARRPDERIDFPSNSNFLLAWDPPSAFRVLGSRRYGAQAIVDVEFSWGEGTQYEGNRRIMSYVFLSDDTTWRLDDVYSSREEFAPPASLSQELRSMP